MDLLVILASAMPPLELRPLRDGIKKSLIVPIRINRFSRKFLPADNNTTHFGRCGAPSGTGLESG
jgi:hypothetical protein